MPADAAVQHSACSHPISLGTGQHHAGPVAVLLQCQQCQKMPECATVRLCMAGIASEAKQLAKGVPPAR